MAEQLDLGVRSRKATRKPKPAPWTERMLVDALRRRWRGESGNGPSGAVVAGVRDDASFDAGRTIDAIGVSFWKSRGLLIDAFECKSSRADFLRELEKPEKADAFCRMVDRFWMVTGRDDIAHVDEVPPTWGLLTVKGGRLVQVRPAPMLHETPAARGQKRPLPEGFHRGFLVALVRRAVEQSAEKEQLAEARRKGVEEGEANIRSRRDGEQRWRELYDAQSERVREFEQAAGISLTHGWPVREPKAIGKAVQAVLNGDHQVDVLKQRLERVLRDAEAVAAAAREQLAEAEAVAA